MAASDAALQAARFVASRCGVTEPRPTASTSGGGGNTVALGGLVGLATVARHLASHSPQASQLLGSTPEAQAQVNEWLTWATTELTPLMDDKLVKVNEYLSTRTYLVGSSATLADLVLYALLHPAAAGFPTAQTLHFCNLLRWHDLLQNTVDAGGFFPRVRLNKPRFVMPPPVTPPPAKPAAAAGAASGVAAPSAAVKAAAPAASDKLAAPSPAAAAKEAKPAADGPAAAAAALAAGLAAAKKESKKEKASALAAAASAAAAAASTAAAGAAPAAEAVAAAPAAPAAAAAKAAKPAAAAAASGKGGDDEVSIDIDMLDIRVGRITKVDKHPNADSLYLEEIDVGEEDKPRQVISGLVKFVPVEAMQGRVVLVVCNLKPAKMRDVMSYGMVLCASNETHDRVEPVVVPEGAALGERVAVQGYDKPPIDEIKPNKKILERLFPDMKTDADGVPGYKGVPFTTSKGPLSSSIPNGWVK